MKRLLILSSLVLLTASSVGCNCCGNRWFARRQQCDPCQTDPCQGGPAMGAPIYGDAVMPGAMPMAPVTPGPVTYSSSRPW